MNKKMRVAALTAALVAGGGSAASAIVATHGQDTASWTSLGKTLKVCDGEQDGHSVYSNFRRSSSANTERYEWFNGVNTCGSIGVTTMFQLRVCENVPYAPDGCSGYVYP